MTTQNNHGCRGSWHTHKEKWEAALTHFKVLLKTEYTRTTVLSTADDTGKRKITFSVPSYTQASEKQRNAK